MRRHAEDELRASELRLAEAQELSHIGSWQWIVAKNEVTWSDELFRIYGVDPASGVASFEMYLDRVHPDDRQQVSDAVERAIGQHEPYEHEYRVVRPGGETRWVHARGEPTIDDDGNVVRLSGYCHDVTERRHSDDRRHEAQGELEAYQGILVRIARGEPRDSLLDELCRYVERRFADCRCTVLVADESDGTLHTAASPSLPVAASKAIDGLPMLVGQGACGTAAATKQLVVVEDTLTDPLTTAWIELAHEFDLRSLWSVPLVDNADRVLGTFAVYRAVPHRPDEAELASIRAAAGIAGLVIEHDRAERALAAAAQLDPLTRLPNRTQFLARVDEALADPASSVAVMFLDLDRFKWINDSLGHPAGDRILVEVAARLSAALHPRFCLARFGGDEFTVLVPDASPVVVAQTAERIAEVIEQPFDLDGGEFFLSVSIGVARNDHPADAFGLVRDADAAMYAAKERGRARHVLFDAGMRERALERVTVETDLRRAIERDELTLLYQPVRNLVEDKWSTVEALVRWQHPESGLLPPSVFVPLAEETGLIVPLGLHILDRAIREASEDLAKFPAVRVAVNVSVVQLADPTFPASVLTLLRRYGVAPDRLFLEVTETGLMAHLGVVRQALDTIVAAGVRILIDDFGTGYSSIARLGELPVAGVKIDGSFAVDLGVDPQVRRVMSAVTDLAHAHDLYVVAEGIETAAAYACVRELGCDRAQGYELARPLPMNDLVALLAS